MAVIQSGTEVTLGVGNPGRNSWGDTLEIVDPGVPLRSYSAVGHDPLTVWGSQTSVRKVVSFAARNVASVPWHAYERVSDTDRQRRADSPVETALHHPRRHLSGFQLMYNVTVDKMLYDRWCVVLTDSGLTRIPPRLLDVKSDFLGNVTSIRMSTAEGLVPLDDLPIAFGGGWHTHEATGVSPMKTLSALLTESRRAVQWRSEQWDQSSRFSGYLKHPESFKDETRRQRFQELWRQFRSSKAGGQPILEHGIDYVPLASISPHDAEDLEGRRLTDVEVCSSYHIPPELVGARPGTFSNIAAFRQMLFGPTLGPNLEEFQQAFNAEIVPALGGTAALYAELDREAAMNGSFAEQAAVLSTSIGGPWLTRNEGRAKQNLPAVDGGDVLITPMNVTEGGLASPRDTAPDSAGEGQWT